MLAKTSIEKVFINVAMNVDLLSYNTLDLLFCLWGVVLFFVYLATLHISADTFWKRSRRYHISDHYTASLHPLCFLFERFLFLPLHHFECRLFLLRCYL